MHWAILPRFEWLLFDGGLMIFLVWQMVSIRRLVRIDRENARQAAQRDVPAAPKPLPANSQVTAERAPTEDPAPPHR